MYEVIYMELSEDYDQSEWILSQTVVTPFFSKHIRTLHDNFLYLARPNDFESLKRNKEFLNIQSLLIRQRKMGLKVYHDAITSM